MKPAAVVPGALSYCQTHYFLILLEDDPSRRACSGYGWETLWNTNIRNWYPSPAHVGLMHAQLTTDRIAPPTRRPRLLIACQASSVGATIFRSGPSRLFSNILLHTRASLKTSFFKNAGIGCADGDHGPEALGSVQPYIDDVRRLTGLCRGVFPYIASNGRWWRA